MFEQLCLFEYLTETDENHPHECHDAVKPATLESLQENVADVSAPLQSIEQPLVDPVALVNARVPSDLISVPTIGDSAQSILATRRATVVHASDDTARIFHLEQAVDQALHFLDELRARVKHQTMLEEQVA